jgi:hypothetical protein
MRVRDCVTSWTRARKRRGILAVQGSVGGKFPKWLALSGFLVVGLALIIVPHFIEWWRDYGIASEIGIAFVVASILGFTIDRWLKAELRTDVFLASVGHLLPGEFRSEVSRIIGYSLICERHFLLVKIESVEDGFVRVMSHVERTIKNRSAYPQRIRNVTHIDEWGYQRAAAEIVECDLEIGGVLTHADEPKKDAHSVYRHTPEKTLKPNQVANLSSKYLEYKPVNDDIHYGFMAPTINPEIEVQISDDLDCIFTFGTASENDLNVVANKYVLKKQLIGTYFPHQSMRVRWWPKSPKR